MTMKDMRRYAPATLRNRDPILAVLKSHLRDAGLILEIASGSGEHCVYFAENFSSCLFQPSDPDRSARASIDAWVKEKALANVLPALDIDASDPPWAVGGMDAIVCINMIHISPWAATAGLFHGAASVLSASGLLFTYGPYRCERVHISKSNELFDASLRQENPQWGVRDLEEVIELAVHEGFSPPLVEKMPANNLMLIFRKLAETG
jgi:cyclopropane fatty-acyl-phospholipid synthase-like methyltransferase